MFTDSLHIEDFRFLVRKLYIIGRNHVVTFAIGEKQNRISKVMSSYSQLTLVYTAVGHCYKLIADNYGLK